MIPLKLSSQFSHFIHHSAPHFHCPALFIIFTLIYFLYVAAPGLSCGIWDPVPSPGIEPSPPALSRVLPLDHRGSPVQPFRGDYWVPFCALMLGTEGTFVTGSTDLLQSNKEAVVWGLE